jgi:hypothetical protein
MYIIVNTLHKGDKNNNNNNNKCTVIITSMGNTGYSGTKTVWTTWGSGSLKSGLPRNHCISKHLSFYSAITFNDHNASHFPVGHLCYTLSPLTNSFPHYADFYLIHMPNTRSVIPDAPFSHRKIIYK